MPTLCRLLHAHFGVLVPRAAQQAAAGGAKKVDSLVPLARTIVEVPAADLLADARDDPSLFLKLARDLLASYRTRAKALTQIATYDLPQLDARSEALGNLLLAHLAGRAGGPLAEALAEARERTEQQLAAMAGPETLAELAAELRELDVDDPVLRAVASLAAAEMEAHAAEGFGAGFGTRAASRLVTAALLLAFLWVTLPVVVRWGVSRPAVSADGVASYKDNLALTNKNDVLAAKRMVQFSKATRFYAHPENLSVMFDRGGVVAPDGNSIEDLSLALKALADDELAGGSLSEPAASAEIRDGLSGRELRLARLVHSVSRFEYDPQGTTAHGGLVLLARRIMAKISEEAQLGPLSIEELLADGESERKSWFLRAIDGWVFETRRATARPLAEGSVRAVLKSSVSEYVRSFAEPMVARVLDGEKITWRDMETFFDLLVSQMDSSLIGHLGDIYQGSLEWHAFLEGDRAGFREVSHLFEIETTTPKLVARNRLELLDNVWKQRRDVQKEDFVDLGLWFPAERVLNSILDIEKRAAMLDELLGDIGDAPVGTWERVAAQLQLAVHDARALVAQLGMYANILLFVAAATAGLTVSSAPVLAGLDLIALSAGGVIMAEAYEFGTGVFTPSQFAVGVGALVATTVVQRGYIDWLVALYAKRAAVRVRIAALAYYNENKDAVREKTGLGKRLQLLGMWVAPSLRPLYEAANWSAAARAITKVAVGASDGLENLERMARSFLPDLLDEFDSLGPNVPRIPRLKELHLGLKADEKDKRHLEADIVLTRLEDTFKQPFEALGKYADEVVKKLDLPNVDFKKHKQILATLALFSAEAAKNLLAAVPVETSHGVLFFRANMWHQEALDLVF